MSGDRCPVCGDAMAHRDRRVTHSGRVVCGKASCEEAASDRFPPDAPAPIGRQQVEFPPLARQPTIPAELAALATCNERVAKLEAVLREVRGHLKMAEELVASAVGGKP